MERERWHASTIFELQLWECDDEDLGVGLGVRVDDSDDCCSLLL